MSLFLVGSVVLRCCTDSIICRKWRCLFKLMCAIQMLKEAVADQRPQLDRLVKTGTSLQKLVGEGDGRKLQAIMDEDTSSFDALKNRLRDRAAIVDDALHQNAEVSTVRWSCLPLSHCCMLYCAHKVTDSSDSFL